MTNAIISGRLGVAVVGGASPQHAIWRDSPTDQVEITPVEASNLLRDATDLEYRVDVDDSDIRAQLELAYDSSAALDLVLFLLDRNLSDDTRACAASELEELISNVGVANRIEQLLYAKPLPNIADIDGAIRSADSKPGVLSFLSELHDAQPAIAAVRDAWNLMPFDEGKRRAFESEFLARGVFPAFAKALSTGSNVGDVVLQFGLNTALKSQLPNVVHVLNAWRQQMPAQPRRVFMPDVPVGRATNGLQTSRPVHLKGNAARNAALTQVEKITDFVNHGKDAQAEQILEELLQEQMRHKNGETHAVKSLCNIAARLRGFGREDFALDCLLRALNLTADVVAFAQLGTLLRDFGRYDEARQAYDKAITLVDKDDVYGLQKILAAKAHILTDQQHYDEAIAAYEAIPFYTSGPNIETALADIYRRMGCFSTATERYLRLIKNYPDLHRAFAGRAEISKRRGDPHRAIRIYNFILRNDDRFHLEDQSRTVYKLAKGHLLKMVGQWDKAFDLLLEVADEGPYNLAAQLQLASLLAIQGQNAESLTRIARSPHSSRDWQVHYFRGLTYFRMGKIAEAKVELLDKIDLAKVLLEDRPLVESAAAFVYLAEGNATVAATVLEGVHSVDRRIRDLKEVLTSHIRVVTGIERPRFPRLRRASVDLRNAMQKIRSGNLADAVTQELLFLLKAA